MLEQISLIAIHSVRIIILRYQENCTSTDHQVIYYFHHKSIVELNRLRVARTVRMKRTYFFFI